MLNGQSSTSRVYDNPKIDSAYKLNKNYIYGEVRLILGPKM